MTVLVNNRRPFRGIRLGIERSMPYLHFHLGQRELFAQPLKGGRVVIGRSDHCDLALPGEDISRVHAVLDERQGDWFVTDRSRHGITINGRRLERHRLQPGDVIGIGTYKARFWPDGNDLASRPTATAPIWTGQPEDLVEADEQGFTATRAVLRLARGPSAGDVHVLKRPFLNVGGPGADVQLDDTLPADAMRLRVVRGRVMVDPGSVPARLAGHPVRELVPALPGEQIELGPHSLVVEMKADREVRERDGFGEMVGRSGAMRSLFGVLQRLARHDYPVLLLGESGTGKELAARALHAQSPRSDGPYVAVNCAAIAATLFESELFGHVKGAFTGAEETRDGAFQRAAGGVLFLDEVGELGLEEQAKLLRALEPGGEIRRVGDREVSHPDVRVVAATNRNLTAMVQEGTFRGDLYHRLHMLTVHLPPLRERKEDILPIARALLTRHHPDAHLTESACIALESYHWPGNVRELRNVLTRAYVLGGPTIGREGLAFYPDGFHGQAEGGTVDLAALDPEEVEKAQIRQALERAKGNKAKAARILEIPRSSLLYKLKRFGLS